MKLDTKKILELYEHFDVVHGPYSRKDGIQFIVLYKSGVRNSRTISYPKAIVESNIGRKLADDETIDHFDGNFLNNSKENLQIKSRKEHSADDAIRLKIEPCECIWCGNVFTPTGAQTRNSKRHNAGPFCSRRCSGSYGASVQNGGGVLGRTKISTKYFKRKYE